MLEIKIPYLENLQLGEAYNRCMETVKDWVLFIDHDVILSLNPGYYNICKKAIEKVGHKAGWITCKTNAIGCGTQLAKGAPESLNLGKHIQFAKEMFKEHGYKCRKINGIGGLFSGFFILTHRKAWEDVGGFKGGFYGVDNDYHKKITEKGYGAYILDGLYVYHFHTVNRQW